MMTSAPVRKAAATMTMLMILPRRWRCGSMSFSGIASPSGLTEEHKPKGESEKCSQAGIHQDQGSQQLILKLDADKKQTDDHGKQDADYAA
jgi:hypothetical protein